MRWLGVALATGLAACADKSVVDTNAVAGTTISGAYGLTSINGRPLPQNLGRDGLGAVDVLAGSIQLNSDATYLDVLVVRRRGGNGVEILTDTIRGGFLHVDRTVMMTPKNGGDPSFFDFQDDGSLSNELPGFWMVYRRDAVR
jgi:hypothetical protein